MAKTNVEATPVKPVKYCMSSRILEFTKMQEFTRGLITLMERRKGTLNGETRNYK